MFVSQPVALFIFRFTVNLVPNLGLGSIKCNMLNEKTDLEFICDHLCHAIKTIKMTRLS